MRKILFAAAMMCVVPMSAHAAQGIALAEQKPANMAPSASCADITDRWVGIYYDNNDLENIAEFEAKLQSIGPSTFQGTVIEPNNWSGEMLEFLLSTVQGRTDGAKIYFSKTYTASGSVNHTVQYAGTLDPSGRRIVGTWTAGGAQGGFEMVR